MAELRFSRVIVDSRFRTSGSSSNFTYDLKEPLDLPPGTHAVVADALIPHSWYTIEAGVNDKVKYEIGASSYTATIAEGSYDADELKTALQAALNSSSPATYTFSSNYVKSKNELNISISPSTNWNFVQNQPTNADGVIGIDETNSQPSSTQFAYPDVRNVHQVLIEADLGQVEVLTPIGAAPVVKRIPITTLHGQVMHYEGYHVADRIRVGGQLISRLNIRLTTVDGRELNLHGSNVSFSILFE